MADIYTILFDSQGRRQVITALNEYAVAHPQDESAAHLSRALNDDYYIFPLSPDQTRLIETVIAPSIGSASMTSYVPRTAIAARSLEFASTLVSWPSATGSDNEAEFAPRLVELLSKLPAFEGMADHIRMIPSHGDPLRHNVAALVRGRGRETLVLAGHYDTVSTANYWALQPLALDPEALRTAFIQRLSEHTTTPAEQRALEDFLSGEFVPGRGMLDMKSGLAAALAVLEEFAADPDRIGNLLFITNPDEENLSRGMRSLRNSLPEIAKEWGLDIVGGINLDATSDMGDGTDGRSIYLGTIGKSLPFAFVIGKPTHAGRPFDGISAHLIGAEILRAAEVNVRLIDEALGERPPPPISLEAMDWRDGYDVTTPERYWVAFNWLSYARTAHDVLDVFRRVVGEAAASAIAHLSVNDTEYHNGKSREFPPVQILTLEELKARAYEKGGKKAHDTLTALYDELKDNNNQLFVSRKITDQLVTLAEIEGPAVVIGFASLLFPHTHLGAGDQTFLQALEVAATEIEQTTGAQIKFRQFFDGISDMSFLGHQPDSQDSVFIEANTAAPALVDHPPPDALSFPVANVGPWGREYHQMYERVHAPYSFEILPQLLAKIIRLLLRNVSENANTSTDVSGRNGGNRGNGQSSPPSGAPPPPTTPVPAGGGAASASAAEISDADYEYAITDADAQITAASDYDYTVDADEDIGEVAGGWDQDIDATADDAWALGAAAFTGELPAAVTL